MQQTGGVLKQTIPSVAVEPIKKTLHSFIHSFIHYIYVCNVKIQMTDLKLRDFGLS
jgi:hypothetical protein